MSTGVLLGALPRTPYEDVLFGFFGVRQLRPTASTELGLFRRTKSPQGLLFMLRMIGFNLLSQGIGLAIARACLFALGARCRMTCVIPIKNRQRLRLTVMVGAT